MRNRAMSRPQSAMTDNAANRCRLTTQCGFDGEEFQPTENTNSLFCYYLS